VPDAASVVAVLVPGSLGAGAVAAASAEAVLEELDAAVESVEAAAVSLDAAVVSLELAAAAGVDAAAVPLSELAGAG
jgi:hypothetical protein